MNVLERVEGVDCLGEKNLISRKLNKKFSTDPRAEL